MSNKLLCSSWIYRWNCFKFQVHTEIFSRGINDRNCGIYSIPKSLSVVTSPNYTKIETKIKNNFYYMINIKYKKKYLGLLIKGTNILSLKPHSKTSPPRLIGLRFAWQEKCTRTPRREMATVYLLYTWFHNETQNKPKYGNLGSLIIL